MKLGTKSILFGVHQPVIHGFFMFLAWIKLHGWTKDLLDPRLHFAFMLHDIGYWGCESMDGPDGERHPELGADLMRKMFGEEWADICLFHSGTMVELYNQHTAPGYPTANPSKLYAVDKLASALYPMWLYKLLSGWSGEWKEYAEIQFNGTRIHKKSESMWFVRLEVEEYECMSPEGQPMGLKSITKPVGFIDWWVPAMKYMRDRAYAHIEGSDMKLFKKGEVDV